MHALSAVGQTHVLRPDIDCVATVNLLRQSGVQSALAPLAMSLLQAFK